MVIVLIILAAIFLGVLGAHAYKQYKIREQQRITENEYNVAVTIWEYARVVKQQVDSATRLGTGVLDFSKMADCNRMENVYRVKGARPSISHKLDEPLTML